MKPIYKWTREEYQKNIQGVFFSAAYPETTFNYESDVKKSAIGGFKIEYATNDRELVQNNKELAIKITNIVPNVTRKRLPRVLDIYQLAKIVGVPEKGITYTTFNWLNMVADFLVKVYRIEASPIPNYDANISWGWEVESILPPNLLIKKGNLLAESSYAQNYSKRIDALEDAIYAALHLINQAKLTLNNNG